MKKQSYTDIFGWLEPIEAKFLQEQAKDKICLELGSYNGKSTVCMAEVAKLVHAVDTFCADGSGQNQCENMMTYVIFRQNTVGYKNIEVFPGKTVTVVPRLPDDFYDFVFIDASHKFKDVVEDIKVSWSKLKIGGILSVHDYGWNGNCDGGPKKAFDMFFGKPKMKPVFSIAYIRKEQNELFG